MLPVHRSDFFTFVSTIERAHRTLTDLLRGPMWTLPVVLLNREPVSHLLPYFKGYDGNMEHGHTWHDGNRGYSAREVFELLALSQAVVAANGGALDTTPPQDIAEDSGFVSLGRRSQLAYMVIFRLAETFIQWKDNILVPGTDVVWLPEALSYEEEWPFQGEPSEEDIESGGTQGEYEWVDDYRRKNFWWVALRMEEWGESPGGWRRAVPLHRP